jgi:serine/threonine protein kinase
MPPEVWRDEPATPRSDVYSLGALLYDLGAGVPPYRGGSPDAVREAALAGSPPTLAVAAPEIDPRFAAVVDRCLMHDPDQRFASADAVLEALEALDREPSGERAPTARPALNPAPLPRDSSASSVPHVPAPEPAIPHVSRDRAGGILRWLALTGAAGTALALATHGLPSPTAVAIPRSRCVSSYKTVQARGRRSVSMCTWLSEYRTTGAPKLTAEGISHVDGCDQCLRSLYSRSMKSSALKKPLAQLSYLASAFSFLS